MKRDKSPLLEFLGESWQMAVALLALAGLAVICYLGSRHLATTPRETASGLIAAMRGLDTATKEKEIEQIFRDQLSTSQYDSEASEALLHLSVAFVVAIVIIATVEIYSARKTERQIEKYRDEVAKEVWAAIFKKLLPVAIVEELDALVKTETVKEDCWYRVEIVPPYKGMPPGLMILRKEVAYTLKNIVARTVTSEVGSTMHCEHDDCVVVKNEEANVTVPAFFSLSIDSIAIPLNVESGTLRTNRNGQLREMHKAVELRAGQSVRVAASSEEIVRLADRCTFVQLKPVHGLRVAVTNSYPEVIGQVDVRLNHPRSDLLREEVSGLYSFDGGMLPGQSLVVRFGPKITKAQ